MSRVAGTGDVAAILLLEQACFGDTAWSEAQVREHVVGERHVVLLTDGSQAYGVISIAGDTADLDRLAVAPDARGRGLARDVLQELLDRARDLAADRMLLEVAVDNEPAVGLYESCGFETINTRHGYYPGGADALVMELAIAEWR